MFLPFIPLEAVRGNGEKVLTCVACGGLVTHSGFLLEVGGRRRHRHVNPAGIECDFQTFHACPGAVALGQATAEHTWFTGYTWRMAFCGHCGQHLGWRYEVMADNRHPAQFWGILVDRLEERKTPSTHRGPKTGDRR
jgi:hypothetical protein